MGTRLIPKVKGHEKHTEQKSSCAQCERSECSECVSLCVCGTRYGGLTEFVHRDMDLDMFPSEEKQN